MCVSVCVCVCVSVCTFRMKRHPFLNSFLVWRNIANRLLAVTKLKFPLQNFFYIFFFLWFEKVIKEKLKGKWRANECTLTSYNLFRTEEFHLTSVGVNFTNPLAKSANEPAQRVWRNQYHQQNFAQLYPYTQLEVTPNFYALYSAAYISKLSVILLAQKLLIKCWWNWPQAAAMHQKKICRRRLHFGTFSHKTL